MSQEEFKKPVIYFRKLLLLLNLGVLKAKWSGGKVSCHKLKIGVKLLINLVRE